MKYVMTEYNQKNLAKFLYFFQILYIIKTKLINFN